MVQPILNKILFKPFSGDAITEGGIIVPDSVRGESNKGVIVAVGNGSKNHPMKLKVGDIGFRVKSWGDEIIIEGEKYFLMDDKAVIALG